jgi:GNAT superfamily N-acetyltransferase
MSEHLHKSEKPSDVLTFGQASNEQLDIVWRLNAQAWAAPISVEDHITRERTLSEQDLTKDGAWKTWVLIASPGSDEIVASCETFLKTVLISTEDGLRRARGFAIASVFTNPKHRGKRMANLLLDHLKRWLDEEGDGELCVLYSDIGKVSV